MNCCGKVCGDSAWDHSKISLWSQRFLQSQHSTEEKNCGNFCSHFQGIQAYEWGLLCKVLCRKLRPKVRENWPQLLEASVLILLENARSHIAQTIKILFTDYKWEARFIPLFCPGSSVFRSLSETEPIVAWPKISVFRNTNSTVIRRKRQRSGQLNGSQIYPMTWCHVDKTWNFTYHNMLIKITRSW
jgi:hypothetical protein